MSCRACQSVDQWECPAEINIHPPGGIENLDKPTVWAFPQLLVCSNCGFTEFVLGDPELQNLSGIYGGERRSGSSFGT